jgi:hypothetical protein
MEVLIEMPPPTPLDQRFSAIVVRCRMLPGAAASQHSGAPSSGEYGDDRKRPERHKVDGSRNRVTGFKIPRIVSPSNLSFYEASLGRCEPEGLHKR